VFSRINNFRRLDQVAGRRRWPPPALLRTNGGRIMQPLLTQTVAGACSVMRAIIWAVWRLEQTLFPSTGAFTVLPSELTQDEAKRRIPAAFTKNGRREPLKGGFVGHFG